MKILQTFVHAAHAQPLATCEDHTGNLFGVHSAVAKAVIEMGEAGQA
jgi:hypothetical protein